MKKTDLAALLAMGWELKEDYPDHLVFKRNTAAVGWHIVIIFVMPIIGNIIYHLMSNETKTILKN